MKINKSITNLVIITLILITGFVFVAQINYTQAAQAVPKEISADQANSGAKSQGGSSVSLFGFGDLKSILSWVLAYIANTALSIAGWLLFLSGQLLDVSIRLTLNIKDFVNATPAIFTVWKTLRDITGLFFIFYLLYAAIEMMTGFGKTSYASTIKNIVIAGVLINFSFFIVSVGIDASNVVSQAIYNAMVPNRTISTINEKTNMLEIVSAAGKSDISNIFMNSLKIQPVYDSVGNNLGLNVGSPIKIILIGVTGVIMMITTAASFVLASLAFIARLVILLFLLAFSSLWFASFAIPKLEEHTAKLRSMLLSQLIFMPVYLLLMYVALRIINDSNIIGAGNIENGLVSLTGTNWMLPYVMLGVNFAIVIFILNLPLAVGLSMGNEATSWLKKGMEKWNAENVWKNVGGWTKERSVSGAASAWKNTGGRAASAISRSEGFKDFASKNKVGELALKGVGGIAGSYNKKLESQVKARTDFAESLGYNKSKVKTQETELRDLRREQQRLRSRGQIDAAKAMEQAARDKEQQISEEKSQRKKAYADRINLADYETLWTKTARKNKVAAVKLQENILKAKLEKATKSLEKVREDIKSKNKAIEDLNTTITNQKDPESKKQADLRKQLNDDINKLITRETPLVKDVTDIEEQISNSQIIS